MQRRETSDARASTLAPAVRLLITEPSSPRIVRLDLRYGDTAGLTSPDASDVVQVHFPVLPNRAKALTPDEAIRYKQDTRRRT